MSKTETKKLPVAFKRKWLKALRSGTFKQGIGKLHEKVKDKDTYCCLGVACVISGISERTLGKKGYIPASVAYKAIPDLIKGKLDPKVHPIAARLACFNDGTRDYNLNPTGHHKGFKGIANWIEKNL